MKPSSACGGRSSRCRSRGHGSRGIHVVITAKGLAALEEAAPSHAREVRRLFIDRLAPRQLDQLSDIATAILDKLRADHPELDTPRGSISAGRWLCGVDGRFLTLTRR